MSSAATPATVLTVVQLIPALRAGGAERSVLEVGRALVQAGHRSVVISAGGRMVEQLQAEGSEHITLDVGSKSLLTLGRLGLRGCCASSSPTSCMPARGCRRGWVGGRSKACRRGRISSRPCMASIRRVATARSAARRTGGCGLADRA
jgi:hypothetical protein